MPKKSSLLEYLSKLDASCSLFMLWAPLLPGSRITRWRCSSLSQRSLIPELHPFRDSSLAQHIACVHTLFMVPPDRSGSCWKSQKSTWQVPRAHQPWPEVRFGSHSCAGFSLCRAEWASSTCSDIPVPHPIIARAVLVSHHCFLPDVGTILLPGAKELESFGGAAHRPAVQVTMKKSTFPRNSQDRGAAALPPYSPESPGLGTRAAATTFGQMNSKSQAEDFHGVYENSPRASPLR